MPVPSPQSQPGDALGANAADHSQWVAALYAELRALAQSELGAEREGHTLSATALVNEVYLKFARSADPSRPGATNGPSTPTCMDRGAFFGAAAQAMRRILVDHARGRSRQKRGSGQPAAGGEALGLIADPDQNGSPVDAVALDEALDRFALEHEHAAKVVELRFFAGLTDQAIGECLGINERTVRRHWTFAKAWLAREMNPDAPPLRDRPDS